MIKGPGATEKLKQLLALPNPSGLCMCGCGQRTPIARRSERARGYLRGEHVRYVMGHGHRLAPVPYSVDEATGCWVWQRTRTEFGHGQLRADGVTWKAHRWYYEQLVGPI